MIRFVWAVLCVATCGAATVGETDRFLPLAQDGGGWSTQVTVVNLSNKPALAVVTFLTWRGYGESWEPGLTVSSGKIVGNTVDLALAPGATGVITTSGKAVALTRGFVEVFEPSGNPLGANAVLTYREGERVVQSLPVALAPAHERRSTVLLDLTDALVRPEFVWVTMTTTATLDFVFRNLAGEIVLRDQIYFDNKLQVSADVRETWPQLAGFRGTVEWTVTFPGADRYEYRFLSGLCVLARPGQPWAVLSGMTLPSDQASISPY